MTLYELLDLRVEIDQKTLKPIYPDFDQVRRAWRKAVAKTHPLQHPPAFAEFQAGEFCRVMQAWETLRNPGRQADYNAHLEDGGRGHDTWAEAHPVVIRLSTDLEDWVPLLVADLLADGLAEREPGQDAGAAAYRIQVDDLPAYIPGERLAGIEGLNVPDIAEELLSQFEHLDDLATYLRKYPHALAVLWKSRARKDKGMLRAGLARKLPDAVRARLPGADNAKPTIEVEIALDWWLAATPSERAFLLNHELQHFAPTQNDNGVWKVDMAPHDTERFVNDIASFGVQTSVDARIVAAALAHPDTPAQLAAFDVLPSGQLELFRSYHKAARAEGWDLAVRSNLLKLPGVMTAEEALEAAADIVQATFGLPSTCDTAQEWREAGDEIGDAIKVSGKVTAEQVARLRGIQQALGRWAS